jgi:hypothetical protein
MIHLKKGEVCQLGYFCRHIILLDNAPPIKCAGLNPKREKDFLCNFDSKENPAPQGKCKESAK